MDVDTNALQSQTELLREIRNELMMSRSSQGGGASGGGMASGAARPGHTFVAAQSLADRTLLGQWNSLGWSSAYQTSYRSTFSGDLAAMVGFSRAPETLTQSEFRSIAGQSLVARSGNALTSLIAPGFAASTNALADEIHQNSGRFIRFGNQNAGALGTGFDFGVERSLSRQTNMMALGDLRMNNQDYKTMTGLGMQSGQFDQTGSADDFMKKVKELASATGDLTRALHMSVQEVSTAMGNLRQMGVSGVAQQRNIMMQVGGAAMVAGMSSPEMLALSGGVAQTGLQLGLNTATTMPAAAQQAAIVRSLSQSGIISPQLMAMGGGTAAVTNNIMNATMGFAGSMGGYLSFLGGGARTGANSFDAMLGGIGASGMGTFNGAMTMDLDRIDRMSGMSSSQMNNLMRNQFESTIRLSGVKDMTSHVAEGMAFQMARGQGMDEAAARIYAKSNFTVSGRRASEYARQQTFAARDSQEMKIGNDLNDAEHSFAGRVRRTLQGVEQEFAGMQNSANDWFDHVTGQNAGSAFSEGVGRDIVSGGASVDAETFSGIINASASERKANTGTTSVTIRGGYNKTKSMFGAAAAIGLGSVGVPALLGFAGMNFWNPLGIGTLAIAGGAYMAGSALGLFEDGGETFGKDDAQGMIDTQKMIMRGNGSDASKLIASNAVKGEAFKKLTSKFDRTKMTGEELKQIHGLLGEVVAENKGAITEQDVLNASIALGVSYGTADIMSVTGGGASEADTAATQEFLSGFNKGDMSGLQTASGSAAGARALRAKANGTYDQLDQATKAAFINSVAVGSRDKFMASIDANVTTESGKAKLQQVAASLEATSKGVGNAHFNRAMSGSMKVAEEFLSSSGLSADDMSSAKKDLESTEGDSTKMLSLIESGRVHDLAKGGKLGYAFQAAAEVADDTDLESRSANNIAAMYHLGDPTRLEKFMADPKNKPNLRKFVEASVLTGSMMEKDGKEAAASREASVLKSAADTLDRINQSLTAKSGTTAQPTTGGGG